jgi:DNA primase
MPDDLINKLGLEAMRLNESANAEVRSIVPKFDQRALPDGAKSLQEWISGEQIPDKVLETALYLDKRKIKFENYDFYFTDKIGFNNRIIIPFLFNKEIVGWTARAINDAKPKYLSEQQPGYLFNLDNQYDSRKFTIVCEGPFDALSIDGCALLGAEIKDGQNWLLSQLGKEIVLVPDRDHEGLKTVEQAIEYGWSVSLPDWPDDVKDINDAVIKLGRLATLWLIVSSKESNSLKIRLKAKTWFKEKDERTI